MRVFPTSNMKYCYLLYSKQYLGLYVRLRGFYSSSYMLLSLPVKSQRIAYSTHTAPTETNLKHRPKSRIPFVNWLYDDFLQGRIKINSFYLYAEITKQVNYLHFFKVFNMEDTFNSWFLITELHVWMLMARLRGDGKNGKTASKTLVAALWDDIQCRAKVLSPGDASVSRKQIQVLSNEFRASLLIYDEGLLGSDMVLASALWYRFLGKSCDDPRLVELLTVYVRDQVHNLESISREDILERVSIKLKPLPELSKLSGVRS